MLAGGQVNHLNLVNYFMDKWIIFDFDGTLADTVEAGVAVINSLAKKYGFRPVLKEDRDSYRDLPSREILKKVGLSLWKLPFLARDVRKKFAADIASQKLYPGILEAARSLKKQGYHLAILTTNSEANITAFIARNNLGDLFDFVHAESGFFSKGRRLKKLIKKHGIGASLAAYVGDETRDVDAAREAGIKSVAVTWGVNSRQVLLEHHPDLIIGKPADLLKLI